jgi:hypothetical protein
MPPDLSTLPAMPLHCIYVLLNLPQCQADTHAVNHAAGGSIWATTVPGWITAIVTAGLLIGAFFTVRYAAKAFHEQSEQLKEQRKINEKQTKVLELQATELRESIDERKREAAERRRAQARQVFISAEPYIQEGKPISVISVNVKNTSQQPIYDLILLWREGTGEWEKLPDPVDLRVLLPGEHHEWGTSIEPSLPIQRFLLDPHLISAAIIFRDAAGVHWRLDSNGQLEEEPATR